MDYREYKSNLKDGIEHRANCKATYAQTQPVKVAADGKVLWKGKVEIYRLEGHPQAQLAFGWGYQNAQKKVEYVTIIGIPPLDNPVSAVKAFLASHGKL
jgi:hypothetical protein